MMDNIEKPHPPENSDKQDTQQIRQYNQTQRETKPDKMSKVRRDIELLERGMQRVRTKLNRLQQDYKHLPSL